MSEVQSWLVSQNRPVVIKPQGTGCGHGIEFFFGKEAQQDVESKVRHRICSSFSPHSQNTVCAFEHFEVFVAAYIRDVSGSATAIW